jgi:hypothetical protein
MFQVFRPWMAAWRATAALLAFVIVLVSGRKTLAESPSATPGNQATVIIVAGASGEEEYGPQFARWVAGWEKASREAGAKQVTIGLSGDDQTTDYTRLKQALLDEPKESPNELWVIFIGHGTYDGKEAKFNLRGPDLSASECAQWFQPFLRPLALIDCSSASAPFLNKLSMPGRVIITATKSGHEQNYARFGQYLSEAIADPSADLDKDGQTSLLEAYLSASRRVAEFYETEGRLATEHPLLDDNGDGKGTPSDWFRGVRAVKIATDGATPDGLRAHQFHLLRSQQERELSTALRSQRDELELAVARLRDSKDKMPEEEYYRRIEPLLIDLARIYTSAEAKPK